MKKIISLFSVSLLLAVSPVVADEMLDAYRALAHDAQSHSSAGVKFATTLAPVWALQYANGSDTKETTLAIQMLLADIFGQAAYREVSGRDDYVASAIKTLTNRFSIAAVTVVTMLLLKRYKATDCTAETATKTVIAQCALACLLQQLDRYLNEEAYAKSKIERKNLKVRA